MSTAETAPPSGADQARDGLRAAVLEYAPAVKQAVDRYAAAVSTLHDASDLMDVLQATAALVSEAEGLGAAIGNVKQQARSALAAAMQSTGAIGVSISTHNVSVSEGRRTVVITNAAEVPPDLMVHPPSRPDLAAILKLLIAGKTLPYAQLSNGGAPYVSFDKRG